jgi:hypothetical protein
MQFLKVNKNLKLFDLTNIVGQENIEDVLHVNELQRVPMIGKSFVDKCSKIIREDPVVSVERKINILNRLSADSEVFETACLMGEGGWKVMSSLGTFPNTLKMPDLVTLPTSSDIIGGSKSHTPDLVFSKATSQMAETGNVDPALFEEFSSSQQTSIVNTQSDYSSHKFEGFSIPWGKITLYSSLADESMDIPVYPETVSDGRSATYTQMPDLLYQYEPWYVYESSGPRTVTLRFHFHRDMWNGDHTKGGANKLIRFCQANCYPRYSGSSVYTSTVTLYINGSVFIHGILTDVSPDWGGPIGHDGWYLECDLNMTFTEIAVNPLNYDSVRKLPIIG